MKCTAVICIIVFCVVSVGFANSKIYRKINPDGSITYTDIPSKGTTPVELPEPQVYTATQTKQALKQEQQLSATQQKAKPSITIISPVQDQTFPNDTHGSVRVQLKTTPSLRESNFQVQFYLNDKAVGGPQSSLNLQITDLNRGEYKLLAKLLRGHETVATSPVVTFHMQRPMIRRSQQPENQ